MSVYAYIYLFACVCVCVCRVSIVSINRSISPLSPKFIIILSLSSFSIVYAMSALPLILDRTKKIQLVNHLLNGTHAMNYAHLKTFTRYASRVSSPGRFCSDARISGRILPIRPPIVVINVVINNVQCIQDSPRIRRLPDP